MADDIDKSSKPVPVVLETEIAEARQQYGDQYVNSLVCHEMDKNCIFDMDHLREECSHLEGSKSRIDSLSKNFKYYIKMPLDGNCFYRSLAFSMILTREDGFVQKQFDETYDRTYRTLLSNGYHESTFEGFFEQMNEFFDRLRSPDFSMKHHFDYLRGSNNANYVVVFLKLVISAHIQAHSEFYSYFIQGYPSIKDYCQKEIEPFGRFSGEIELSALSQATGIKIRVFGLMSSVIPFTDYPEDDSAPIINLIYKPGHYELLMPENPFV